MDTVKPSMFDSTSSLESGIESLRITPHGSINTSKKTESFDSLKSPTHSINSGASSPKSTFSSTQERAMKFQKARMGGVSTPTSPLESSSNFTDIYKSIGRARASSNAAEIDSSSRSLYKRVDLSDTTASQNSSPTISPASPSASFSPASSSSPSPSPVGEIVSTKPRFTNDGAHFTKNSSFVATKGRVPTQSVSQRRAPNMDLSLSSLLGEQPQSSKKRFESIRNETPPLFNHNSSFGVFDKYINIKNGALNFNGKASIHSNGVKFSSGEAIKISTNDLTVLEELGRGNYGTVTKALHQPTNVIMAIKEVKLELDEKKLQQILMELDVLHKCNSPFIVDFFGAFFVEGAVYMCIEYMDGGSLDQIYHGGISELQLAYITECVVKGLKELKDQHNIIHRDVKPTNILVNTEGKIKLCDFGVSGNLVASKARTQIGCQSYMPPERISFSVAEHSTYTVQSDVWSLGLSLVEIAIGKYPYPPSKGIFEQLNYIVNDDPPTIPKNLNFSDDVRNFIRVCLNKVPEKRPAYGELLNHPWLVKIRKQHFSDNYEAMEKEFAVFVKQMLKKNVEMHEVQKQLEYEKLNISFQK